MGVIYWAGDSTVQSNNIYTFPQTGLGQELGRYLKAGIRIENHARNGRSTKSFLDEGRFGKIMDGLSEGDFLFIQFGHNDEKKEDPSRYTSPQGGYYDNLLYMAESARKKGAYPVLITPLERRKFSNGILNGGTHTEYVSAMKKLSSDENIPLIDLNEKSRCALVEAGDEASKRWYMHVAPGVYDAYPDGKEDDTHLSCVGAVVYAGLIAKGLEELGGIYAELLAKGQDDADRLQ